MKTLPEVLHFWKSLVSSVRNCNTSTPHRLAADSAGPLARSRAHSPDRGGPGLARPGVPPGLLPPRPARGRLARPVTGRSPERRAPKPRPCGYAARPHLLALQQHHRPAQLHAAQPGRKRRASSLTHARAQKRMRGARRSQAHPTLPSRRGRDRAGPASRARGAGPAPTASRGPASPRGAPRQPRAAAATPRRGLCGAATGGASAARASACWRGAAGGGRANGRP